MQDHAAISKRDFRVRKYSPETLLHAAADEIIAFARPFLPNLSNLTVLVPNLRGVSEFANALGSKAQTRFLILPRITTLNQLAQTVPLVCETIADNRREALLYNALKERPWFLGHEISQWETAARLRQLFDEMTCWNIKVPQTHEEFVAQLESAYRVRANQSLQLEARLCHELWYALHRDQQEHCDAVTLYHLQLAQLAAMANGPLFTVGLSRLTYAEQEFFTRYAEREPVFFLEADPLGGSKDLISNLLNKVWIDEAGNAEKNERVPLAVRAKECRQTEAFETLRKKIQIYGAQSVEEEARAVEAKVRDWLIQGGKHIAVIVLDRLVARRTRALLERAKVLVDDETGWTLSTTSASSVVARWLDLISDNFYYEDLLDFCKSPFVFSNWDSRRRKRAVYLLEQCVRKQSIVLGLTQYRRAIAKEQDTEECGDLLLLLEEAARNFDRSKRSISAWLEALQGSLNILDVTSSLARDNAGRELLRLLAQLKDEMTRDPAQYRFSEWRHWLNHQLESSNYRDASVTSPVVFTHLGATTLRQFDGVAILGCDARRLPDLQQNSLLVNQAVRKQLGLPTVIDETERTRQELITLLATSAEIYVTWQSVRDGEQNLLNPYFQRLRSIYELELDDELSDRTFQKVQYSIQVRSSDGVHGIRPTTVPTLAIDPDLIPGKISASAYNSLMDCPYQFFARHVLELNELDEVKEAMEKIDYGRQAHEILHRFHRDTPFLMPIPKKQLIAKLEGISEQIFKRSVEAHYLSRAWELRWKKLIPAYIDWQLSREASGWRWKDGEVNRKKSLSFRNGSVLTVQGRLDRIDFNSEGSLAVLDYKTSGTDRLKKKLASPGEDVQLPFYSALLDSNVDDAAYVSLESHKDKLGGEIRSDFDVAQLSSKVMERLLEIFTNIYESASVRAQGMESACKYCEMHGLCRKDYWN